MSGLAQFELIEGMSQFLAGRVGRVEFLTLSDLELARKLEGWHITRAG
jgi:hypothetical protein